MMMRIARAVLTACLCLTAVTLIGCEDDPTDGQDVYGNERGNGPAGNTPDAGTP